MIYTLRKCKYYLRFLVNILPYSFKSTPVRLCVGSWIAIFLLPVKDHKCSFYKENYQNPMTRFVEIDKNDFFYAYFDSFGGQKW